jgi:hypothetical protein
MTTITELKEFLENFNIQEEKITEYLENKEIVELQENLYLLPKDYQKLKNEISNDNLIYIKLKYMLPSIQLLQFIKNNTKNILKIKSDKRALDFTYGKDLFTDLVTKNPSVEFTIGKFYIVTYDKQVLGYVQMAQARLNNEFHVGHYLKEN